MGFNTYKITYEAELVSNQTLTLSQIHEAIVKAVHDNANGAYLVGNETTKMEQTGVDDE